MTSGFQTTAPISFQTPIVNPDGTMTEPFRRLLQALTGNGSTSNGSVEQLVAAMLQPGSGITITPDGHLLSDPTIAAEVQPILDQITDVHGSILYRDSTGWAHLPPGTSGDVLQTNGPAADPTWVPQSGGGGGSSWVVAGSWTWSTNVPNVDFTGLGAYNELLFVMTGVSASPSGLRRIQYSVDNGSTFFDTSGDYLVISNAGASTNQNELSLHGTDSTAARSGAIHILNTTGDIKVAHRINRENSQNLVTFAASASPINALRFSNNGGGNLTAGSVIVFAR